MSLNLPIHPVNRHPLTGQPLRAIALHPRTGAPVWPILGGDDTVPPAAGQPDPAAPPAAPERPENVSEQEWAALGDTGKQALVRERERANAAERALAAARARPAPPKPADPPKAGEQPPATKPGEQPDIAAIVQQAVAAAIKPFQERDEQREAEQAATAVRDAVIEAAKPQFHDATDALSQIDLTTVLDGNGQPDQAKIDGAIKELLTRKPHLGKVVDDRRFAQPGAGPTPGGSTPPLNDRVKATLARMQERAGVKFAES
ncbi:hypothetical protein [Nocardioides campestrisoli]|uniref:hypothetical protein n=1 Tax=Nocardioides campestrisoli TaxID=2736757 RepID=UPI0015E69813|nr:hypothetical protein [Nocardioides campestrisoli]